MRKIGFLDAGAIAQSEEMAHAAERGEDSFVIGLGGKSSIYEKDGTGDNENGYNAPLSENAIVGMALGAAITGSRPIVAIEQWAFSFVAMDQICNEVAKMHYTFNGQAKVPLTIRGSMMFGNGIAAQHSERPYSVFMGVPGLKIIAPSTPTDMYGLLKSAIVDDNPVLSFEAAPLWGSPAQEISDEEFYIPLGKADIKKEGSDVTIVAISSCVPLALMAAADLEKEGISAEVLDPRTLVPMDYPAIYKSVAKTGRLIVADNTYPTASCASEIVARVMENSFESLKKKPVRITAANAHIPYSRALEKLMYPTKDKIVDAVHGLM